MVQIFFQKCNIHINQAEMYANLVQLPFIAKHPPQIILQQKTATSQQHWGLDAVCKLYMRAQLRYGSKTQILVVK